MISYVFSLIFVNFFPPLYQFRPQLSPLIEKIGFSIKLNKSSNLSSGYIAYNLMFILFRLISKLPCVICQILKTNNSKISLLFNDKYYIEIF